MTWKWCKQSANEVAAGWSGSHCGWEENTNQANITSLGHQAEKPKEWDSVGKEYCNCQEEKNLKCSFLMAGSRENMKRNKSLERIWKYKAEWKLAGGGWYFITMTSHHFWLWRLSMSLRCERTRESPRPPEGEMALSLLRLPTSHHSLAVVVSQLEIDPSLA